MRLSFNPPAAAPPLVVGAFLIVILAGIGGAVLPALGYMPVLGGDEFSLDPLRSLVSMPGIWRSVSLSLWTGLAASAISFIAAICFVAAWSGTASFRVMLRLIAPFLSIPHAATAFGLAFLIAPSGWLLRLLSPWATGLTTPPDLLILQDPLGISMIAGMVMKEVPFLLLVIVAALQQSDAARRAEVAASLGYSPVSGWMKAVLPVVYARIRLPIYAVIAYATSTVDIALILGPGTPPPLAVRLTQLMADPDLTTRFTAAAGAILQLLSTLFAFSVWRGGEWALARLGRRLAVDGRRSHGDTVVGFLSLTFVAIGALAIVFGLVGLIVSSFAAPWKFPEALPQSLTTAHWERVWPTASELLATTVLLAVFAVALSLLLIIAVLEAGERRQPSRQHLITVVLYAPMLVPQISFMFGLKYFFLQLGFGLTFVSVLLSHVVFVLPYVFLSLVAPWQAWNQRFGFAAGSLGASPLQVFWRVRLPMMLGPLLAASAIGFAVSVAQYLPTVVVGAGRVATITTEAVALASGGDRRVIGVYAVLQIILPIVAFGLSIATPAIVWRNRRGLRVSG